ncbi:hypothetical protein HPG69_009614 [Diceros bicornis minor]|uniref:Uncharacterized protein n=1 Tax=Diceros bicornis minor TaxID=77932 RepID=A0A7J7EXQ4_DICBM|nr:hypothetical protein HPG69_009614 [Diceros bicornis minor]
MMEEIEGNTLVVFVQDINANQHQIKQAVKKLSAGCAPGQLGLRAWRREGAPGPAPDWHASDAANHFGHLN